MKSIPAVYFGFLTLLTISLVGAAAIAPPSAATQNPDSVLDQANTDAQHIMPSNATTSATASISPPAQLFERAYNTTSQVDIKDTLRTAGGDYVLFGAALRNGSYNGTVLKLSPAGEVIWQQTFDANTTTFLYGGAQTADGGFVIAGSTERDTVDAGCVIKLDAEGEKEWSGSFTYGGGGRFYDAVETSDGEHLVAGVFETDDGDTNAEVLKLSDDGRHKWNSSYSDRTSAANQGFRGIDAGDGDSYHLAGYRYGDADVDALSIEINSVGETRGSSTYGSSQRNDWFFDVAVASDGEPYYTGIRNAVWNDSRDQYTVTDAWIYHDAGLSEGWSRTGSKNGYNRFSDIDTAGGRVVASGVTAPVNRTRGTGYAVAYYSNGIQQWTLTDTDGYEELFEGIAATENTTYIVGFRRTAEAGFESTFSKYSTITSANVEPVVGNNAPPGIDGAGRYDAIN